MEHQASFDFTAPPPPPPGEVEILVAFLLKNPGFHTARQLTAALDLSDRKIRQLAEASAGQIVSGPGSPGYCHLHHCPTEKLAHIADTLRSQARSMLRRSILLRNLAYSIIR
jgi:hypothetical protein